MRKRLFLCVPLLAAMGACQTPPEEEGESAEPLTEAEEQALASLPVPLPGPRPPCGPTEYCAPPIVKQIRYTTCEVANPCATDECNPCDSDQVCVAGDSDPATRRVSCLKLRIVPPLPWPPLPGPDPRPIEGCEKTPPPRPGVPFVRNPCECFTCAEGYTCQAPADRPICVPGRPQPDPCPPGRFCPLF